MKLKYFLRGLGVGMVVTALVLCIAYRNSSSGKSVVEQAKELGMVFPQGTSEPDVTATPESENTKKPKSTKKAATKKPAKKARQVLTFKYMYYRIYKNRFILSSDRRRTFTT